ncbi:hypothetical protein NQ176_g1482 [Zarea fungicola]|uniref:Uncharacterized protein n=1 Tax=Zarea fungicola TaxID=93591 RepID=A0ACC1NSM1_9HYPO|nr:hypothetical protein NQ176_g1482 [Lecanicillium fungicola]
MDEATSQLETAQASAIQYAVYAAQVHVRFEGGIGSKSALEALAVAAKLLGSCRTCQLTAGSRNKARCLCCGWWYRPHPGRDNADGVGGDIPSRIEMRRASDSAADTTGAYTESTCSHSTADATTPEASFVESSLLQQNLTTDDEDEYEEQIQQAIRLSLLEGVNDRGQSPHRSSIDEFVFAITYKEKSRGSKKKSSSKRSGAGRRQSSSTASTSSPRVLPDIVESISSSSSSRAAGQQAADADADLVLAISLSMQEEDQQPQTDSHRDRESYLEVDQEFPPLATGNGSDKGKGVTRW